MCYSDNYKDPIYKDCPECEGKGKIYFLDSDEAGMEFLNYDECRECEGTGQVEDHDHELDCLDHKADNERD